MRSIWTGQLSLSIMNMPMKLGSSTKDNSLDLHMVRIKDGAKVEFTRVAGPEREEVPWPQIGKGWLAPDGRMVILTKAEQDAVFGEKNRTARVLMFTDASNIPPMAVKSSYWVQPDVGGEKVYALLAAVLQETGKVAVITFAMRQRMAVAVLRPQDGYLALESLEWDTDLLSPDFQAPPNTAEQSEIELTKQLIATMSGKYDHAAQKDVSTAALKDAIDAKLEKGEAIQPPQQAKGSEPAPVDLAAQLQAAVAAQKKPEPETEVKPPRQRSRKPAAA